MTYEEILAYLESLKGTPVDLQAAMQGNPNEVNPVARGGTDVAWGNVPGLEQFYSYDQANNQGNFNLSAALPEIQRLGYQVMQAKTLARKRWRRGSPVLTASRLRSLPT